MRANPAANGGQIVLFCDNTPRFADISFRQSRDKSRNVVADRAALYTTGLFAVQAAVSLPYGVFDTQSLFLFGVSRELRFAQSNPSLYLVIMNVTAI